MATTTPKLGLPRPTSTDNVTLANQQALIDAIDNGAAKIGHTHDGTVGNGSKIAAANITVADAGNVFTATDVEGALSELFTNVSNGKTAVASAITGKGVAASGSDTFTQLSTKIGQISTGTGNAVAADVLAPKTFTNGSSAGITGTMPNRGAVTITPGPTGQTIPAGYHNGSGVVPAVVVPAANVLTGTTIAGTAGTMPNLSKENLISTGSIYTTPASYNQDGSGNLVIAPTTGYYTSTVNNGFGSILISDPDFISANLRLGINIFGLVGTLEPMKFASGTVTTSTSLVSANTFVGGVQNVYTATVTGLSFQPKVVVGYYSNVPSGNFGSYAVFSNSLNFGSGSDPQDRTIIYGASTISGIRTQGNMAQPVNGFILPHNSSSSTCTWFAWG